jgi:flagellar M-ring protein FliF
MPETITQVSNQLTQKWNGLSNKMKWGLGIGLAIVFLIILLVIVLLTRPQYQSIFDTQLDLKEAAQVTEVLEAQKIDYKVVDNGRVVQVEKANLNQAKLALASENVPKGRYTFEDAINNTMSTTQDEKKAKLQQLAKSNMEAALETIDGIAQADVTLVIPEEKNSFIASKQKSSASVLLTLSSTLDTKQIEGIARYIASSVNNLEMEDVTIIDSQGNNLYNGNDTDALVTTKQQEYKIQAENEIKTKVNTLLEPIFDEVRVSPNLVLDFSQFAESREEYIPQFDEDGRGIIQKEIVNNTSSSNAASSSEPGTATNGGDVPSYTIGGSTGTETKSSSKDIDYVTNKIVTNTVKNQGDIDYDKSSVAVNVFRVKQYQEEIVMKTLEDMTWEEFKAQNSADVPFQIEQEVIDAIASGTGIKNVVVYGYERPMFIDKTPYEIAWRDYLPFILLALIIFLLAIALFKFKKHDNQIEVEPQLEVEEMLKIAKEEVQLEEIEIKENLESKRLIEKFVNEKPEAVANLLRNWLNSDDWE